MGLAFRKLVIDIVRRTVGSQLYRLIGPKDLYTLGKVKELVVAVDFGVGKAHRPFGPLEQIYTSR